MMNTTRNFAVMLMTMALTAVMTSQARAHNCAGEKAEKPSILEIASTNDNFETLTAAVKAAGLTGVLAGEGPYTVFAPTDEAFAKLPKETLESLLRPENKDQLVSILTYHVAAGGLTSGEVLGRENILTVYGQRLDVANAGGVVTVDGATVTAVDIKASNGVIHVIDTVLVPETRNIVEVAGDAGTFGTLLAAARAAGLAEALATGEDLTVFAPTDEAFAKLPAGTVQSLLLPENKARLAEILKYHVVQGRVFSDVAVTLDAAPTLAGIEAPVALDGAALTVAGAKVVATDIEAANGVIHVIDSVMIPGQ